MGMDVGCEVCFSREGMGAEQALEAEVREEWQHDSGVIAIVTFSAEGLMFE